MQRASRPNDLDLKGMIEALETAGGIQGSW